MNDIWRAYHIDGAFDEKSRLEFSSYGEIKSITANHPKGRLINGSLQEGYPIIRFKKLTPMDEVTASIVNDAVSQIKSLKSEIKALKLVLERKDINYNEEKNGERKIVKLNTELEKLTKKLQKDRKKINKKRSVYFHILVHKAVAELFLENDDPKKTFVIHKNFNKLDNNVDNLMWATKEEVIEHSFKSPKWIEHNLKLERSTTPRRGFSKLTYNDVVFIKIKLSKGEPMARLARRFGVSDMQIHRIKTGENWGDVKVSLNEKEISDHEEETDVKN